MEPSSNITDSISNELQVEESMQGHSIRTKSRARDSLPSEVEAVPKKIYEPFSVDLFEIEIRRVVQLTKEAKTTCEDAQKNGTGVPKHLAVMELYRESEAILTKYLVFQGDQIDVGGLQKRLEKAKVYLEQILEGEDKATAPMKQVGKVQDLISAMITRCELDSPCPDKVIAKKEPALKE